MCEKRKAGKRKRSSRTKDDDENEDEREWVGTRRARRPALPFFPIVIFGGRCRVYHGQENGDRTEVPGQRPAEGMATVAALADSAGIFPNGDAGCGDSPAAEGEPMFSHYQGRTRADAAGGGNRAAKEAVCCALA